MNTTIKSTTVMLSKRGMKEIKKIVAQLEHDRQAIIRGLRELSKTNNHDDRLDQVERLARLEAVESELEDKKHTIANAKIIPSRRARLKVAIGSVVDLVDQQGRLFRYTLVESSIEANPSDGRISIASPLGQNLLGKTAQEIIEWGSGLRRSTFQLVRIS